MQIYQIIKLNHVCMRACMHIHVCMHNVHEILQNRREPYRTQVMTSVAISPCCTILELLERNTYFYGWRYDRHPENTYSNSQEPCF
jgi:hypothetical protein